MQTSLGHFSDIEANQSLLERPKALGLNRVLSGKISAMIRAKSRKDAPPIVHADITVTDAQIAFMNAKNIALRFHTDGSDIRYDTKIEKGSLGAEPFQEITSTGWYGSDGNLNIIKTNIISSTKTNSDILASKK